MQQAQLLAEVTFHKILYIYAKPLHTKLTFKFINMKLICRGLVCLSTFLLLSCNKNDTPITFDDSKINSILLEPSLNHFYNRGLKIDYYINFLSGSELDYFSKKTLLFTKTNKLAEIAIYLSRRNLGKIQLLNQRIFWPTVYTISMTTEL